jgi:lipid-A-disaccharide synthase
VGLPNILLNEEVAPELLQESATPENLAESLIDLFYNKTKQKYVINRFYKLHQMLRYDASKSAATAVLELINNVA